MEPVSDTNLQVSVLYHELCCLLNKTSSPHLDAFFNKHSEYVNSFILLAVNQNHTRVIEALLGQAGCDVNVCDEAGETIIRTATRRGYVDAVRLLLAGGADAKRDRPRAVYDTSDVRQYLEGREPCANMTLIMEATVNNQTEVLEILIAEGCLVNESDPCTGKTALHLAASNGSVPCARQLLDAGAQLNAQETRGNTPLMMAVFEGHIEMAEMFLSIGCDVNTRCCLTRPPLIWAIDHENIPVVQLLLHYGANPNLADDYDKRAPLHFAAEQGLHICVDKLLTCGAFVNALDVSLRSPILLATRIDSLKIVESLLEQGADPNVPDNLGSTPIVDAVYEGHFAIARALIRSNCRLNVNISGASMSLYSVCLQTGHYEGVQLLHQAGLDGTREMRILCDVPLARPKHVYVLSSNLRFVDWLKRELFNPRMLSDYCRISVRRAIGNGPNFRRKVMSLPTAGQLKEFLMFDSNDSLTVMEL